MKKDNKMILMNLYDKMQNQKIIQDRKSKKPNYLSNSELQADARQILIIALDESPFSEFDIWDWRQELYFADENIITVYYKNEYEQKALIIKLVKNVRNEINIEYWEEDGHEEVKFDSLRNALLSKCSDNIPLEGENLLYIPCSYRNNKRYCEDYFAARLGVNNYSTKRKISRFKEENPINANLESVMSFIVPFRVVVNNDYANKESILVINDFAIIKKNYPEWGRLSDEEILTELNKKKSKLSNECKKFNSTIHKISNNTIVTPYYYACKFYKKLKIVRFFDEYAKNDVAA